MPTLNRAHKTRCPQEDKEVTGELSLFYSVLYLWSIFLNLVFYLLLYSWIHIQIYNFSDLLISLQLLGRTTSAVTTIIKVALSAVKQIFSRNIYCFHSHSILLFLSLLGKSAIIIITLWTFEVFRWKALWNCKHTMMSAIFFFYFTLKRECYFSLMWLPIIFLLDLSQCYHNVFLEKKFSTSGTF